MSPRSRALVAAALVLTTFGQGVVAQTTDAHHPAKAGEQPVAQAPTDAMATMMQGMMPMMQMMSGMQGQGGIGPGERVEGRIAFLKAELSITEAQGAAWNGFADALRGYAAGLKSANMMGMDMTGPNLLDRLAASEKKLSAELDGVRALRASLAPLWEMLSDEQRVTAAQLLPSPMGFGSVMQGIGMTGGMTGGMMPATAP